MSPLTEELPVLPLRNAVLFPGAVSPINVGRPRSVRLVEERLERADARLVVLLQRSPDVVEPTFEDLEPVGVIARVVRVIRHGGSYNLVLAGVTRVRVTRGMRLEPYMIAEVEPVPDPDPATLEEQHLAAELMRRLQIIVESTEAPSKELQHVLGDAHSPGRLADLAVAALPDELASIGQRQSVLELFDVAARLRAVAALLERRLEVLRVRDEISTLVQTEMSRSQREYVLRQQLRDIKSQLGEASEDDEVEQLRDRISRAQLPQEAERAAKKQLGRLSSMQASSSEYQVTRNYVEWLADLPWSRLTPDSVDVAQVKRCLDEDHFGLEQVKKRILEYAAVRQLRRDKRGPILLFVGPPGVGKTSLGKSIARAMGRRYGRIALGGVRDEAEIRGHRRTYVGALPGRIIQALKKVGTRNPVLVLDEVDKLGSDVRGDPASALLEVLDPEQNEGFIDHYIDLPFDLSSVVFLATANAKSTIPPALRDRMEIIEVPGYTRKDKLAIARAFLVPKQLEQHGLTEAHLSFEPTGLERLVDGYTREAGVRGLEREIAAVCRDTSVRLADGRLDDGAVIRVDREHVELVLGAAKHRPELAEREPRPGIATGLTARDTGGELLLIEASRMPGTGEIRITGNLGTVMKESAETAVSFVRSRAERLRVDPAFLEKSDLHLHVARARAGYDAAGSSVTMFVAISSLLLGLPVRHDVAVTGELTLRGAILAVDSLKDKLLAAHRAGLRAVLIPAKNAADLESLPEETRAELTVHLVDHVEQVLPLMLAPMADPAA